MNPTTIVNIEDGGYMEMETAQIKGIDSTKRVTRATLAASATLVIHEKIMTHGSQTAETDFSVDLNGEDSGANVISRSVAKGNSRQKFVSMINGNNPLQRTHRVRRHYYGKRKSKRPARAYRKSY